MVLRLTIFVKFLLAALGIALVPLLVSSSVLFSELQLVSKQLSQEIGKTAESDAADTLEMRARLIASDVSDFLRGCEQDLMFLSKHTDDPSVLQQIYETRTRPVWKKTVTTPVNLEGQRRNLPVYRTLAVINRDGTERFVIHLGKQLPSTHLRNVSRSPQTEFKSETYFQEIRQQKPGSIYVSHLTGFHISKDEQLAGAAEPEHARGKEYTGVIRMGTPLYKDGQFHGALVLSIDHQHLMEFTQHIIPGSNQETLFPSYRTGNYAFMFDDEGWIITHPKFWDLRGVDKQGQLVPPYTQNSPPDDIQKGRIPFNLNHAGFIHPNYPLVANMVRQGKSGVAELKNVGGSRKMMAYAPIAYTNGAYARHGIFGGITIGYQVNQFQEQSRLGSVMITTQLTNFLTKSAYIIIASSLLAAMAAWLLARGISRPLLKLNDVARQHAQGVTTARVPVYGDDEISELAQSFNHMVEELEQRKERLVSTLEELEASRLLILNERNFKENILESISSAITTFDTEGKLTSFNTTALKFLGATCKIKEHYSTIFRTFSPLMDRITKAYTSNDGAYGREPLRIELDGIIRHFDAGIFPIGDETNLGLTVTLRDETVRENLRDETVRLERLASLGKLAAGISHEIRNPLTGISLLLDDLHDRAPLDDQDRNMLSKALAEIERIERLLSALLTFATPQRSSFSCENVLDPIRDVCLLMQKSSERQGTHLQVDVPHQAIYCALDMDKIRQALLNLIKNALEAVEIGGAVTVTASQSTQEAFITIKDTGPGIDPEDMPLLFEPFFTRKGAGTGLGLSITRQILEEHHGTITVSSSKGVGTVFTITLPRCKQEALNQA